MPDETTKLIAKDLVITLIQKDLITLEKDNPKENMLTIQAYLSDMYHLVHGMPYSQYQDMTNKLKR